MTLAARTAMAFNTRLGISFPRAALFHDFTLASSAKLAAKYAPDGALPETDPKGSLMKGFPLQRGSGGDGGIRTLGTPYRVRRFSKPLPSATRPRLRQAAWIASRATLRNAELTPFVLTRHKSGM